MIRNENILCLVAVLILGLSGMPEKQVGSAKITRSSCDYMPDETSLINKGWKKIFEDQFDEGLSKWQIWHTGAYNHELQLYQPNNVSTKDGILLIQAQKETLMGLKQPKTSTIIKFAYSSGRLESKKQFFLSKKSSRIRIMARIKLPKGYGLWPAFWAYGKPYPTQGEIDILEARGAETDRYLSNFYEARLWDSTSEDHTAVIVTQSDLSACFHVYELEWTKDALHSYFDGKLVDTKKNDPHIATLFGKREHLVLNLAVGGGLHPQLDSSKINPGTMYVDWVKVFQSK